MTLTRIPPVVRVAAALAAAAVLLGPSAHAAARTPPAGAPAVPSAPLVFHDPSEAYMMGPHCGATSIT